jgi:hypothetical protein
LDREKKRLFVTVSERQRLELYESLGATLGPQHAEVLMEYLPPVGWSDVARRHDVDLLRAETRTEMAQLRTEMAGLRTELRTEMADLRIEMHREFNRQLVWLLTAIFGSVGAILGLIGYVS